MTMTVKHKNPKALDDIVKRLKKAKGHTLAVGIPVGSTGASARYPDGTSVLMVAAVNNFGSDSRGIPARSFMSLAADPMIEATAPIAERLAPLIASGKDTSDKVLEAMGSFAVGAMQQTITDLADPPNSPETIAGKKSSNPLVDTGLLTQSITHDVRKA